METSRDDVSIAIRSALLSKGTKQRFSLFALVIISVSLIFLESIELKPLNYFRSLVKDIIYKGSETVSMPSKGFNKLNNFFKSHFNLYEEHTELKKDYENLKNSVTKSDFLELENSQLRKLIEEQTSSPFNFLSARIMLDKQSMYLNSFIINAGSNKDIKNGMAVLHGENFIGRIVDVNFFSSRVLLISDLNSKIPVITEPSGYHAILSGKGDNEPNLEYLPENYNIQDGEKVYTSGKEGIFSPGIPVGEVKIKDGFIKVILFSDLNQITFVNIKLGDLDSK
tara:strand:+ start:1554 stop:2399 length:846 start_codon:yes stop_codon:yes gene_type:complete